jgi:GNAT superfamily N-acetyltransferase
MIRRALAPDLYEVAALYHAVWHETQAPFMPQLSPREIARRSVEFFVERMTPLLQSTLVTEQTNRIVAFAAWKGPLLGQLFVSAAYRGTGTGSSLLRAAEIEMARDGTTEGELNCVVGNERARRFYERMGWAHKEQFLYGVTVDGGQVDVPHWRMTKVLSACNRDQSAPRTLSGDRVPRR